MAPIPRPQKKKITAKSTTVASTEPIPSARSIKADNMVSMDLDDMDFIRGDPNSQKMDLEASYTDPSSSLFPTSFEDGTGYASDASSTHSFDLSSKRKSASKTALSKQSASKRSKHEFGKENAPISVFELRSNSITVGMQLLGAVQAISDTELVVSLPNQLIGHVSIMEISEEISKLVTLVAENEDMESGDENELNDSESRTNAIASLPQLQTLFRIGELLRCQVIAVEQQPQRANSENKTTRKIGVSLRPHLLNAELPVNFLFPGLTLQASVQSIQDHGMIMDMGIANVSGFLKESSLTQPFKVGQVVQCVVVTDADAKKPNRSGSSSNRVIQLAATPRHVSKSNISKASVLTKAALQPGLLVSALVKSVSTRGLLLSFLDGFEGVVDWHHAVKLQSKLTKPSEVTEATNPDHSFPLDLKHQFKEGEKVRARILYVRPTSTTITSALLPHQHPVALTLQKNLVDWETVEYPQMLHVGSTLASVTIRHADPKSGLLFSFPPEISSECVAHARITRLGTAHGGAEVDLLSGKGRLGINTSHPCRVFSLDRLVPMVEVTLDPEHLNAPCFRYEDISIGEVCSKATILKFDELSHHLVVSLCGVTNVKAFCPATHLSDLARLQHPGKKFKVGMQVKCRVLFVDAERQRVTVTLKKSLLKSTFPILTSLEHASHLLHGSNLPLWSHGVVCSVKPFGCVVQFYGNNTRGMLSDTQLSQPSTRAHQFQVGNVVLCRVVDVDVEKRRMRLSLTEPSLADSAFIDASECPDLGAQITQVYVERISVEEELLVVRGAGVVALLPKFHLSDDVEMCQQLFDAIKVGTLLQNVIVVSVARKTMHGQGERTSGSSTTLGHAHGESFAVDGVDLTATGSNKAPKHEVRVAGTIHAGVERAMVTVSRKGLLLTGPPAHLPFHINDGMSEGVVVVGWIRAVHPTLGIFCQFGGSFTALVPMRLISDSVTETIPSNFVVGQTLVAVVARVQEQKCFLSLKPSVLLSNPTVADITSRIIPKHHSTELKLVTKLLSTTTSPPLTTVGTLVSPRESVAQSFESQTTCSRTPSSDDFSEGRILTATVVAIKSSQVNVSLPGNVSGRVHMSEFVDSIDEIPLENRNLNFISTLKLKVHDPLKVKVIGVYEAKTHRFLAFSHNSSDGRSFLDLTMRANEIDATVPSTSPQPLVPYSRSQKSSFVVNQSVLCFMQGRCGSDAIWVSPCPHIRGKIPLIELPASIDITNIDAQLPIGCPLDCRIAENHKKREHLDISARPSILFTPQDLRVDSVYWAKVYSTSKRDGVLLNVSHYGKVLGGVPMTDLSDNFTSDPLSNFSANQMVRCVVTGVEPVSFSLRTSDLNRCGVMCAAPEPSAIDDKVLTSIQDLSVGSIVRGYVRLVSLAGCFVQLGRNLVGKVKVADFSDDYLVEPTGAYEVGQLVRAKVLAIDISTQHVVLSLRDSHLNPSASSQDILLTIEQLMPGSKMSGEVVRIEPYGVFVALNGTAARNCRPIRSLCHISQASEKPVEDLNLLYSLGDVVTCRIASVNLDKHQVQISLKNDDVCESDSEIEEEVENEENEEMENQEMENQEMENQEMESNQLASDFSETNSDSDGETDNVACNDTSVAPLASVGFQWHESSTVEDGGVGNKKSAPALPARIHAPTPTTNESIEEVEEREDKLANGEIEIPTSAEEFDRLLLASPNSSFLWIQYMSFFVQVSELDQSRAVAERALKSINYREEKEKRNVWMAYMNLESSYGTEESLDGVFKRALMYNEPKHVYLALLKIFQKNPRLHHLIDDHIAVLLRKFKTSFKVWMAVILHRFQSSAETLSSTAAVGQQVAHAGVNTREEARSLLKRSLLSLPKHKHVKMISKFAMQEYRVGEIEQARTLFEGLIGNFPKRVDLWSIYLDMEVKYGLDAPYSRRLFERVIHLNLSMKKKKFMFKKYLDFEKRFGTEQGVQHVVEAAKAYVLASSNE